MMKHLEEDIIYKFNLELLDKIEISRIREHINECSICREKYYQIKKELDTLKSFNPVINKIDNPIKNSRGNYLIWIKSAAVLFIGMLLSYTAINFMTSDMIYVKGQTFVPQNSSQDSLTFIDCANVDIYTGIKSYSQYNK